MTRLALLSASDKTGIVDLAKTLTSEFGFDILSSGGTALTLQQAGIEVTKVSDYTGFPEILGGRVKTLQPRIHGGILARPDQAADLDDLTRNDIRPIRIAQGEYLGWSWQSIRSRSKTHAVWPCWHRHDCRPNRQFDFGGWYCRC